MSEAAKQKNNLPKGTNASQSQLDKYFGEHTQSIIVLIIFLAVLFSILYLVTINHGDDKVVTLLISLLGTIFGFYLGRQSIRKR